MTDHRTSDEVKEARLEGELYIRDCPGVMAHTVAVILDALTAAEAREQKQAEYISSVKQLVDAAFERGRREVALRILAIQDGSPEGTRIEERAYCNSIFPSPDEPKSVPVCETCEDTGKVSVEGQIHFPCPNCEECSECGGCGDDRSPISRAIRRAQVLSDFQTGPCPACNATGRVLKKEVGGDE